MYQRLVLTDEVYETIKRDVKLKIVEQGLTLRDLSDMTGYTYGTIRAFMSHQKSKFVAMAIIEALHMELQG